ncbi:glycoside hydrolase family 2 protein [Bacteroidota bacterium]
MRKYTGLFFILICILPSCLKNSKEGQRVRISESFNDGWRFAVDPEDQGERDGWYNGLAVDKTIPVTIPHTWNIMESYEEYTGTGWYEKSFGINNEWIGKPIFLQFGAIYRDATIWLNGQQILERIGSGYTPFRVKITDYIQDGQNKIIIRVNNRFSNFAVPYERKFDWANDGGITRDIHLIKSHAPSIEYVHLSPSLKGSTGRVTIRIKLNEEDFSRVSIWIRVREENQKTSEEVFTANFKVKVSDKIGYADFEFDNAKAWHFDQPNLYKVDLAVGFSTMLTDTYTCNIGFREFVTQSDKIRFNGEIVRLPGIEWMPGSNPAYGMAEPDEEIYKMLGLMKEVNAVFTRFHWQQAEALFDWCDRNGIMVQEELPLWQAPYGDQISDSIRQIVNLQIEEMISAHYNHPSIVAWGIGNELQGQSHNIKSYLIDIIDKIHQLDTTRIINYVSNSMHTDIGNDATLLGHWPAWNDYTGYWYLGSDGSGLGEKDLKPILENFHTNIPNKPLMISEYGLCEPVFKGGDPERIRHFKFHTAVYDELDYVAGFIYFSLNDYRTHMGEEGVGKLRQRVHGIVDLEGNKKPSYQIVQERLSPIENLVVEVRNNKVYIRGQNRNGIPSYSLRGYYIEIEDHSGVKTGETINLPDLEPGDPFNAVINDSGMDIGRVLIKRPNGYNVIEKGQ